MLYRKWCCICNVICLQWAQRLYHQWFSVFFGAIPVAVLSTQCKINFIIIIIIFWGRWRLSVIITFGGSELVPIFYCHLRRWHYNTIIRPRVRQVTLHCIIPTHDLAESIVTQLIYTHIYTHTRVATLTPLKLSFASTSSRYSFVVNATMRLGSIQQVSWYMGKPVNTSYVALRCKLICCHMPSWQHRMCNIIGGLPVHQLLR